MAPPPISLDDARAAILARVAPLPAEQVELGEALGRRLAADAVAAAPVQPFDNSAMDGFAVRAADTAGATAASPAPLTVVAESRAGHPAERGLGPGEAIAISTGAMLPAGADAVVRVEDTRLDDEGAAMTAGDESRDRGDSPINPGDASTVGGEPAGRGRGDSQAGGNDRGSTTPSGQAAGPVAQRVLIEIEAPAGLDVRRAGEDLAAGDTVLRAGDLLGAAALGALATIGLDPVRVHRRPRVAVLTSGDELTPPGRPLAPGAIRDSNSRVVPALARHAGAEVVSVAWTPDDPDATAAALEAALEADVAIVCGGVSVGAHDHVKAALAGLGVEEVFWRVALKPGGPTWFGTRGDTLVFGLPGNPVSVFATFLLLARPALVALAGGTAAESRTTARLGANYPKPPGRLHAARARLELTDVGWVAWPAPRQGSHVFTSLLEADCLALMPAESGDLAAGTEVEVVLLDRAG
jgi:molybdopterin molybdotransferase